jgi:uncharacterized membrane protein YbhN (UPF0104 family)
MDWKMILKWGGTIASLTLFVWLLTKMDWRQSWEILQNMPVYSYGLALLLLGLGQFLNSVRWYILLKAQNVQISIPETFEIFMGGAFASNFLPSTIGGDTLRFLAIARITKDRPLGLASVILDRLVNLLATCTLIPFSISVLRTTGLHLDRNLLSMAGLAVFNGKAANWIKRVFNKYLNLLKRWLDKPVSLLLAFVVAWISSVIILSAVWVLARGMGIQVSLWQVLGANTISYFITLLPISISGYGLREITITSLYTLMGATLEQATALALISRIFNTLITLPGVIWMQRILSETKDIKPPETM